MKKRILSILLILTLAVSTAVCATTASGASVLYGDADGDGVVTIMDVTCIQRHLIGIIKLDDAAVKRSMVSGEDELDITDATYVQRYLADMIDKFPIENKQPEEQEEVTKVKDNITIYFSNNKKWSTVNAYIYNNDTGAEMKTWPGTAMTNPTVNDLGQQVFSMTVDATKYNRVIFNNGSTQTHDLPLSKASSGYFIDKKMNGKLMASLYPYGQSGEGKITNVNMDYPDGYKKRIYIWTPEGYDPSDKSKKYSVLYMCDGQNLFGQATTLSGYEWECDETVLSLMQNGGDGIIVVGIACGNTEALRNHELTPNIGNLATGMGIDSSYENGGGKVFSDFVTDTVIPYVENNYNVNSIRGIAGSSSGGIEAFYIGMENMDKFRYIGALSPAFILYNKSVWDEYLGAKDFSGNVPRIYFFNGNSKNDQLEQALYTNATAMEGWMKAKGYPADKMTTVVDQNGTHSEAFWALYFPEMLSWCLDL